MKRRMLCYRFFCFKVVNTFVIFKKNFSILCNKNASVKISFVSGVIVIFYCVAIIFFFLLTHLAKSKTGLNGIGFIVNSSVAARTLITCDRNKTEKYIKYIAHQNIKR